jgi:DNA-directed RNA polymerase subunit F
MDTKPEILEETPIPMFELKTEMSKIKKRDEELNFRAQKTDEYINTFVTLKQTEIKALLEELKKMSIPRLKDEHLFKIIDLMPTSPEDVKLLLQGYTLTVSQDNQKKIAEVVKKYVPEAKKKEDKKAEKKK